MNLKFINRELELLSLSEKFDSGKFELVILYGKRRVGKTFMLEKLLSESKGIYFLSDKGGTLRNGERFKRLVSEYFGEQPIESNDFYDIFGHIAKKSGDRALIVIDEFPYLIEKDDSIPSLFQRIVDQLLLRSRVMLVLCGSSISMVEDSVLSHRSPLYGRRTMSMRLDDIAFTRLPEFFPHNNFLRNVEFYSILGGMPHYLRKFSDRLSTKENVASVIFNKSGSLYEEVDFILREEFRSPETYKNIMGAIASGSSRLVHISDKTGIKETDIRKYINNLISLGLIKRLTSVHDTKGWKGIYVLDNNFFAFWFRFVEPFKSYLEIDNQNNAMACFNENFNSFVGKRVENLVRTQLLHRFIPFPIYRSGVFWSSGIEIDAVALNREKKEIAFVEVKWKENVNCRQICSDLMTKSEQYPHKGFKSSYFIVARSFRNECKDCHAVRLEKLIEKQF